MVWGIHAPPVPSHFLSTPFVPGSTSIKKNPTRGVSKPCPSGLLASGASEGVYPRCPGIPGDLPEYVALPGEEAAGRTVQILLYSWEQHGFQKNY